MRLETSIKKKNNNNIGVYFAGSRQPKTVNNGLYMHI